MSQLKNFHNKTITLDQIEVLHQPESYETSEPIACYLKTSKVPQKLFQLKIKHEV